MRANYAKYDDYLHVGAVEKARLKKRANSLRSASYTRKAKVVDGYVPNENLQNASELIKIGVPAEKALRIAGYGSASAKNRKSKSRSFRAYIRHAQDFYQKTWIEKALSLGLSPEIQVRALAKIVATGSEHAALGAIRETNRIMLRQETPESKMSLHQTITASNQEKPSVFIVPAKMEKEEWEAKAKNLKPVVDMEKVRMMERKRIVQGKIINSTKKLHGGDTPLIVRKSKSESHQRWRDKIAAA